MSDSHLSVAGILFLISVLCACGSGQQSFDALAAQTQGGDQSASNGKGGGKGQDSGKGASDSDSDSDEEETCDAGKIASPETIVLCAVGDDETQQRQVCTDARTAISKYGLDPSKPNLVGTDGDHLGAC